MPPNVSTHKADGAEGNRANFLDHVSTHFRGDNSQIMCPHTKEREMNSADETLKTYAIRFSDSEVADVRDMTKVEAVAPAVRSLVLKAIERHKTESAK